MAPDKAASATVPIDEEIQRFAIRLDENDCSWMLPILEDLVESFEDISESGDSGVELRKLNRESELPVSDFFETLAHETDTFEEGPDKSIRLNPDRDSANANLHLG